MENEFKNFISTNWQSFLVGIVASTIASGIVAILVIKFFRVPKLELHLDFIPQKTFPDKSIRLPVLDISIINKKWWVGFNKEEILFGLFVPSKFFEMQKKLMLITKEGEVFWENDLRGKEKFLIEGKEYFLFRNIVSLPVYPDTRTHFIRIKGDFDDATKTKIFYYFETPYGRVPSSLKFGERKSTAENGMLPYAEIEFK